ncbi:MAG TPA: hypothetical protein VE986_09125, partial [Hyphomicrobiales bacterium]|nr:hypothetical protein [Hyphomicrobiales bacterium]
GGSRLAFGLILLNAMPSIANALAVIFAKPGAVLATAGWMFVIRFDVLVPLLLDVLSIPCAHAASNLE